MKYQLVLLNSITGDESVQVVIANNVFDAIDTAVVEDPEDELLMSAEPIAE